MTEEIWLPRRGDQRRSISGEIVLREGEVAWGSSVRLVSGVASANTSRIAETGGMIPGKVASVSYFRVSPLPTDNTRTYRKGTASIRNENDSDLA